MKFILAVFLSLCLVWSTLSLRRIDESKPIARNARIVGGQLARAGQYPWIAAIWKYTEDGRYFCTGSIYNEQWILTAAQCVYNATRFIIQVGSNQLEGDDPFRVTLSATEYFYEPRFAPPSLNHDVALIKLHLPIEFNDYIQPVVILGYTVQPVYHGRPVEAAGWGQTTDDSTLVNELHFVDMTILGQTACKEFYGEQLWGSMCCAEGNYNEGICFGDVGTPLMSAARVGNHSIQIAIGTFLSLNGCESTDPTGYTVLVDNYRRWIRSTISEN